MLNKWPPGKPRKIVPDMRDVREAARLGGDGGGGEGRAATTTHANAPPNICGLNPINANSKPE